MSMSAHHHDRSRGLDRVDPVWARIRHEAEEIVSRDPALASFVVTTILNQNSLEEAVVHRIASRLDHGALPGELIAQAYEDALEDDRTIGDAFRADIMAVADRDPACQRFLEPLLYFKGFHAIETHRLAHWLWNKGRRDFALYLQSRSSEVSILQGVTLGGTGKEGGDRHPKIRQGVLIGAGAKILGNIEVGQCARVAAGSVVLKPVPRNTTVAGVPARVVGEAGCAEPARSMDQIIADKGADI
jgi:serine O-acetyltransferase